MTTQAAFFTAKKEIEIRDLPLHEGDQTDLYTSVVQGISAGTEMLFFRDTFPKGKAADEVIADLSEEMSFPIKYGYINVARSHTGELRFFFFPHQLHWYADRGSGIEVPEGIAADDALFLAQMETALGIVHDLNPVAGDSVVIAGAGVIGMLTALILKRSHWGPLFVADIDAGKESWCRSYGLEFIDFSGKDWSDRAGLSGGVDCSVNATSSGAALQMLIEHAAFEGTVVEASWYGSKAVSLNLGIGFHRKRLHLKSSQVSHIGASLSSRWTKERRFAAAFDLIREIEPSQLISHRYPFSRIQDAFECIDNGKETVMQIVLDGA